jgi:DNA-binding response OmpR family regulator
VIVDQFEINPTLKFSLLTAFVRHPQQVLSKQQLLELAWREPYGVATEQVRLYVRYLRRKLAAPTGAQIPIETVRGFGYGYRSPTNRTVVEMQPRR